MRAFITHSGIVAPLDRPNVDTDAIIPKQYLKLIKRSGFGPVLFDDWRYLEPGEPGQDHGKRKINPDFVLNQPLYDKATILLARENFGCGSSREHAVWALTDFGFQAVIAPGFADIFFNNSFKNGLLPIVLTEKSIDSLFQKTQNNPGYKLQIDLRQQRISGADFKSANFEIDEFRKHCLLNGLDDIDLTLAHSESIRDYENKCRQRAPWLL